MADPTAYPCPPAARDGAAYCDRCDVLVDLDGFHVIDVTAGGHRLVVTVESAPPGPSGCPSWGTVAYSHGRGVHRLVDVACFARPVVLVWRKRTWRCAERACLRGSFTAVDDDLAPARALLSTRARWWALSQIRREGACVQGLARQLGTTWRTV